MFTQLTDLLNSLATIIRTCQTRSPCWASGANVEVNHICRGHTGRGSMGCCWWWTGEKRRQWQGDRFNDTTFFSFVEFVIVPLSRCFFLSFFLSLAAPETTPSGSVSSRLHRLARRRVFRALVCLQSIYCIVVVAGAISQEIIVLWELVLSKKKKKRKAESFC